MAVVTIASFERTTAAGDYLADSTSNLAMRVRNAAGALVSGYSLSQSVPAAQSYWQFAYPELPTGQGFTLELTLTPSAGTFQARMDAGAWVSATSPKVYTSLTDATHTFEVRAINAAGNVDPTPASRTFTVDAVTPAPVYVLLSSSAAQSVSVLALRRGVVIVPAVSAAHSAATAALRVGASAVLSPAVATSAATLALRSTPRFSLATGGSSSATLGLTYPGAPAWIALTTAASAGASLSLGVPAPPPTSLTPTWPSPSLFPALSGVYPSLGYGLVIRRGLLTGGDVSEPVRGGVFAESIRSGYVLGGSTGGVFDEQDTGGAVDEPTRDSDLAPVRSGDVDEPNRDGDPLSQTRRDGDVL